MNEEEIKKRSDEELVKEYYAADILMEAEIGLDTGYLSKRENVLQIKEASAKQEQIEKEIIERLKKTKNPAPFIKAIKNMTNSLSKELQANNLLEFFEKYNLIKRLKDFKRTGSFRPKSEQKKTEKQEKKKTPPGGHRK